MGASGLEDRSGRATDRVRGLIFSCWAAYCPPVDDCYQVAPWSSAPDPAHVIGRALVLPGAGYTVDHPALFWACQVLTQVGWRVTTMRWCADQITASERRAFVEAGANFIDAESGDSPRTLVLAKSLGTYAVAWASTRGYPAIWLTPVMTDEFVTAALRSYAAPSLLVGGTSDPLWSRPNSSPEDQQILEFADVNHALHRAGNWRQSLDVLQETLASVETFAAITGGCRRRE